MNTFVNPLMSHCVALFVFDTYRPLTHIRPPTPTHHSSGIPLAFPQWRDGQLPFNGFADKMEWEVLGTVSEPMAFGFGSAQGLVPRGCGCEARGFLSGLCGGPGRWIVHAAFLNTCTITFHKNEHQQEFDGEFVNKLLSPEDWESGAVSLAVDEETGLSTAPRPTGLIDQDEIRGYYDDDTEGSDLEERECE